MKNTQLTQLEPQRRIVALLLSMCVALLAFAGTTTASQAQDNLSLVVVKTRGEGKEGEPADVGAVFHATQLVGLHADSTSALGQMVTDNPRLLTEDPGYPQGEPFEATTDAEGKAYFTGLPAGVYRITQVATHEGNTRTDYATPFLALVGGQEITQARVKNQPQILDKKVIEGTVAPGSSVDFALHGSVPLPDINGELHQYIISDNLESRLSFAGIRDASITNTTGTTALTEGKDYRVTVDGNRVKFELTGEGLKKLASARKGHPETAVNIIIRTTVRENADTSTPIANTAEFAPDGYSDYPQRSETATAPFGPASSGTMENVSGPAQHQASATTDAGKQSPGQRLRDSLASTGVSILLPVLIGIILILFALIILKRRRREEQ